MNENLERLKELATKPDVLTRLRVYTWISKDRFRKDFDKYADKTICWSMIATKDIKKLIEECKR